MPCEFCASPVTRWIYPAASHNLTSLGASGSWTACDDCYLLIETNQLEKIIEKILRNVTEMQIIMEQIGTVDIRAAADRLWQRFILSRNGSPFRNAIDPGMPVQDRIALVLKHVALEIKNLTSQRPQIWRNLDEALAKKSHYQKLPVAMWQGQPGIKRLVNQDWPNWCFMPALVYESEDVPKVTDLPTRRGSYPEAATLGGWRQTQGIYVLHEDLLSALWTTPLTKLPVELLHHLPEWSILTLLPEGAFASVGGVMAAMCQIQLIGRFASMTVMLIGGEGSGHFTIPLFEDLEESVRFIEVAMKNPDFARKSYGVELSVSHGVEGSQKYVQTILEKDRSSISGLLSVLLYLCSEQPELSRTPPKPQVKRVKGGLRVFPPDKPTVVQVGYVIGSKLRLARKEHEESTRTDALPGVGHGVLPHIRKSHWHLYWVGPRGQQTPKINWLSPIAVLGGPKVPVVHPVGADAHG